MNLLAYMLETYHHTTELFVILVMVINANQS